MSEVKNPEEAIGTKIIYNKPLVYRKEALPKRVKLCFRAKATDYSLKLFFMMIYLICITL